MENAEEKKYRVDSPLKAGGKRYEIGQPVSLPYKLAEQLKLDHVISDWKDEATKEAGGAPAAPVAPTDAAERLTAVKEAIGKLNIDSGDLWTAGGLPKTEAIAQVTGWPVTAAERDAAWAEVKPEGK